MKYSYLVLPLIAITLFSCNTDDPSTDDDVTVDQDFFPLTANSNWTYDNQNEELGPSTDFLYVEGTATQNGNTYTNLDAEDPASAFMTQLLSDNLLRNTSTSLFINGSLGSPIEGLPDITLPLNDVPLYDTSVDISGDPVLETITGTIIQDVMEIPIEINYIMTSTMLATPNTATEDAPQIASQLSVNMEIIAMIPVGPVTLPFTVMQPQDVLLATNTYTDGIGLTDSQVLVTFTLEDLSGAGVELPFPEDSSNLSTQILDSYTIGE